MGGGFRDRSWQRALLAAGRISGGIAKRARYVHR